MRQESYRLSDGLWNPLLSYPKERLTFVNSEHPCRWFREGIAMTAQPTPMISLEESPDGQLMVLVRTETGSITGLPIEQVFLEQDSMP